LRKNERVLKEKEELEEKMRKEIANTKKQSIELTKLLKNDALRNEYEDKSAKMNADLKWLH
jgi:hypothetical protein